MGSEDVTPFPPVVIGGVDDPRGDEAFGERAGVRSIEEEVVPILVTVGEAGGVWETGSLTVSFSGLRTGPALAAGGSTGGTSVGTLVLAVFAVRAAGAAAALDVRVMAGPEFSLIHSSASAAFRNFLYLAP